MKRSLCLFVIVCLGYCSPLFAQQVIEGHYGKQKLDVAYSAAATTDGGYIITGLTQSQADSNGDIVVIKTTAHGDTAWSRTYGGPLLEGGNFVMQTADGGYMVSGHTQDFGAEDCDAFLMKLDQYGTMQWIRTYGGDSDDISYSVVALSDGGYLVGGLTESYGYADSNGGVNKHVYFIRTNSVGDTAWTKVYSGTGNEECYSIASVAGGGFLAVGYSTSWGSGEADGWLMRLDASGDTLWTRFYKNTGDTYLYKILPTTDNGYIIAGNTTATGGNLQGMAIKLDAAGNELWKKTYSDTANMILHDVAQLPTGGYLFGGSSYATPTTGNAYVLATDANGVKLSDALYGGVNSYAYAIAAQGNNSYLIAGGAAKYGDPAGDLYFMEMDNTISAHVATLTAGWPHLYPNPVTAQPAIIVLPASEANETVHIEVMTVDGRCIFTEDNVLAKDIVISRSNFPPAQYLFRVTCKDGMIYKGKFVVD